MISHKDSLHDGPRIGQPSTTVLTAFSRNMREIF
jgi:hypothetical protein